MSVERRGAVQEAIATDSSQMAPLVAKSILVDLHSAFAIIRCGRVLAVVQMTKCQWTRRQDYDTLDQ